MPAAAVSTSSCSSWKRVVWLIFEKIVPPWPMNWLMPPLMPWMAFASASMSMGWAPSIVAQIAPIWARSVFTLAPPTIWTIALAWPSRDDVALLLHLGVDLEGGLARERHAGGRRGRDGAAERRVAHAGRHRRDDAAGPAGHRHRRRAPGSAPGPPATARARAGPQAPERDPMPTRHTAGKGLAVRS